MCTLLRSEVFGQIRTGELRDSAQFVQTASFAFSSLCFGGAPVAAQGKNAVEDWNCRYEKDCWATTGGAGVAPFLGALTPNR
jgi:hypothetical protein